MAMDFFVFFQYAKALFPGTCIAFKIALGSVFIITMITLDYIPILSLINYRP